MEKTLVMVLTSLCQTRAFQNEIFQHLINTIVDQLCENVEKVSSFVVTSVYFATIYKVDLPYFVRDIYIYFFFIFFFNSILDKVITVRE